MNQTADDQLQVVAAGMVLERNNFVGDKAVRLKEVVEVNTENLVDDEVVAVDTVRTLPQNDWGSNQSDYGVGHDGDGDGASHWEEENIDADRIPAYIDILLNYNAHVPHCQSDDDDDVGHGGGAIYDDDDHCGHHGDESPQWFESK